MRMVNLSFKNKFFCIHKHNKVIFKKFSSENTLTKNNYSNIEFTLPNQKKVLLSVNQNSTIEDITKEIRKNGKYENIEFQTWDNKQITISNDLSAIFAADEPIFFRVDNNEYQIIETTRNEVDKSNEIRESQYNPIINVKEDVDCIKEKISKINRNKNLSDAELTNVAISLFKLRNLLKEDHHENKANLKELNSLFEEYYRLKQEYIKDFNQQQKYIRKSEIFAKSILLCGGLFFVSQLALLYYGTFILFSWDITEPICYLVSCANLVLILYFRKKFGNNGALKYFTNKFYKKIIKFNKFDDNLLKSRKLRILEIENQLN